MALYGSQYDYIIHIALIATLHNHAITNYKLPTSRSGWGSCYWNTSKMQSV